jgi:hypothetical protein
MQPSLGIQYNSDGGSGLLGEGWDLPLQSITVDTRWGVPRYSDTKETETYSMNGVMLATIDDSGESSVAHRGEATYAHPGGKWVMSSVEISDGITDDGPDMKTAFEYSEGRQERHEREFLGFGKVITKSINPDNALYRQTVRQYDVSSVYTAGNPLRSTVEDAAENVSEYYSYRVTATNGNFSFAEDNSICSDRAIAFVPQKYAKSVVYEGEK